MNNTTKNEMLERMRNLSDRHEAIKKTISSTIEDTKKLVEKMIEEMDKIESEYQKILEEVKKP